MYIFSSSPAQPTNVQSCASTGVKMSHQVLRGLKLNRLVFTVSVLFNSTGDTVINYYKRITLGSDTGRVLLGTLNIKTGAVAGQCYYKDLESANLYEGQEIIAEVATAATTAGSGSAGYVCEEAPETALNNASMVASS